MKRTLIGSIKEAQANYPILSEIPIDEIIKEYYFIKENDISLTWNEASWQAYKRMSRIGRTIAFNRQMRGKFFAAITEVERIRKGSPKVKTAMFFKNAAQTVKTEDDFRNKHRRITALENAIMGDVEKI